MHAQANVGRNMQKHDIGAPRPPRASDAVADDYTTTGNRSMPIGMTLKAPHSTDFGLEDFRFVDTDTLQRVRKDTNPC